MKYQKSIDKVKSGAMSRADLVILKRNAEEKLAQGDLDAKAVLSAINMAKPADSYVLFMGFCPDPDFNNRLDIEWREQCICRFDFPESEVQLERFNTICTGDLVVLKKIKQYGKTMTLHGYGRVKSIAYDEKIFDTLSWSGQVRKILLKSLLWHAILQSIKNLLRQLKMKCRMSFING